MSGGGTLQQVMRAHRQRMFAREERAVGALTSYYHGVISQTQPLLDRVLQQIADAQAAGQPVKLSWLYEQHRLQTILAQLQAHVDHFAGAAQSTIRSQLHQALADGSQYAQEMLRAATGPIPVSFGVPTPGQINASIGSLSDGSPYANLFDSFGEDAAAAVKQALVTGIATGQNPRVMARAVRDALGIPLQRAQVIAQDQMIRAYRSAALENYRANSDVVGQWRWTADLSARTCAVCLAMDGTLHGLDEDLNSHVGCRCAAVPVTRSYADILGDIPGLDLSSLDVNEPATWPQQTGAEWFDRQSAETQISVLGQAGYSLYTDGKLTLSDLVGVGHDPDWGMYRYQKSLRQLGLRKGA